MPICVPYEFAGLLILLRSRFCYEAAVCGGIPIINTLQTDFQADSITRIMGIMNGTTNFMLCKMEDEGADYADVLKQAQKLGFAEADPTADVEGHDVQAKIALLGESCQLHVHMHIMCARSRILNSVR